MPVWVCEHAYDGLTSDLANLNQATETASHTSRGQFVAIEFTLNIFGVVVAYWLGLYVVQHALLYTC